MSEIQCPHCKQWFERISAEQTNTQEDKDVCAEQDKQGFTKVEVTE